MAAEVEAQLGNYRQAETYVNAVRARAGNPVNVLHTYIDDYSPDGRIFQYSCRQLCSRAISSRVLLLALPPFLRYTSSVSWSWLAKAIGSSIWPVGV